MSTVAAASERRVKHIPTGNNPSVGIFTPDGSEVYAGHLDDSKVVVIDAQSFQSLATIQVGTNPVTSASGPTAVTTV